MITSAWRPSGELQASPPSILLHRAVPFDGDEPRTLPSDRSAYAVGTFLPGPAMHFARPDFEAIVPRWFPNPKFANQASEPQNVLGLGMILRRTPHWQPLDFLLTAAVYLANIDMAINDVVVKPGDDGRMERVEGVKAHGLQSSSSAAVRDGVIFAATSGR